LFNAVGNWGAPLQVHFLKTGNGDGIIHHGLGCRLPFKEIIHWTEGIDVLGEDAKGRWSSIGHTRVSSMCISWIWVDKGLVGR